MSLWPENIPGLTLLALFWGYIKNTTNRKEVFDIINMKRQVRAVYKIRALKMDYNTRKANGYLFCACPANDGANIEMHRLECKTNNTFLKVF